MNDKPESSQPIEAPEKPERTGLRRLLARKGALEAMLLPVLAVLTALIIGAIIIAVSNADVLAAWRDVAQDPLAALSTTWATVRDAYAALFEGPLAAPRVSSRRSVRCGRRGRTGSYWRHCGPLRKAW